MIRTKRFILAYDQREDRKNGKCYNFLKYFELNQGEWATIALIANSVGRNLKDVLEQGDAPTQENDPKQTHFPKPFLLGMSIPRKRHEAVG